MTELARTESGSFRAQKIIVAGSAAVGKSSLVQKFTDDFFNREYCPTTAEVYRKVITLPSLQEIQLDILDTAGQEDCLRDSYYKLGEGFLCVYSVTMRQSFEEIDDFISHIRRVRDALDVTPIILLATKADLESEREVSKKEGKKKAASFNIPFFETSAATGQNIKQVFRELSLTVLRSTSVKSLRPQKGRRRRRFGKGKKSRLHDFVKQLPLR